jgi:hypothetical protein
MSSEYVKNLSKIETLSFSTSFSLTFHRSVEKADRSKFWTSLQQDKHFKEGGVIPGELEYFALLPI